MPTIQGGPDAFDHGFDVPADYDAIFGTPTAVTTPLYQDRLNSLEINSPGNEGVRKNISGSPGRAWMAMPVRVPSTPSSVAVVLAALHSVTTNIQARVAANIDGNFQAYVGAGTPVAGPSLAPESFHWLQMIYNTLTTTHTLHWRLGTATQTPATVAGTASDSVDYGQVMSLSGNGTLTWHVGGYWLWGTASADDDWLDEPEIFTPTGLQIRRVG